jgi:hypothetical protein
MKVENTTNDFALTKYLIFLALAWVIFYEKFLAMRAIPSISTAFD